MNRISKTDAPQVTFSVTRLAAWAPSLESPEDWSAWGRGERKAGREGEPPLKQLPPLLRRHAGQLGRMVCEVAFQVLERELDVPVVYCSRHGETKRSVEMLQDLAHHAVVSPTSFSLSVHNSAAGLLAIARHDRANHIAIAAGEESAAHGVIEACALLADGAARVLLVVADSPIPDVYSAWADVEPVAFAWAAMLEPPGSSPVTVQWSDARATTHAGLRLPAALEVLRFLRGDTQELTHQVEAHQWRWSRSDRGD